MISILIRIAKKVIGGILLLDAAILIIILIGIGQKDQESESRRKK